MAVTMTLQEAIDNAAEWQEAFQEAKDKYHTLRTEHQSKPLKEPKEMSKWFRKMINAQQALEWYFGYKVVDSRGNEQFIGGTIQYLAGEAQRIKERSNLGERFKNRTFDNFDKKLDISAYNAARNYANDDNLFKNKRNSLIIFGRVGSGKTHLAAAIANDCVERGVPAIFGTWQTHLERIKNEFEHTGENKALAEIKSVPLLVIDDIGKERKTEWTQSVLFDVVNYRYEHLLPIIFTTNFTADELANHCEHAVFSRMYEMSTAIETIGADYRERD